MIYKEKFVIIIIGLALSSFACGNGVSTEEYNKAVAEKESLAAEYESVKAELDENKNNLEKISKEYSDYKKVMAEYEGLAAAEAESRRIEAEAIAESKAKEEKEIRAAQQAEREAKEKAGYDTGITYDQLARYPDNYDNQKVKFKGEVLQVMEGGKENQLRIAVSKTNYGWYSGDEVLYCGYDPSIIEYRLLEKDIITIYGTARGLFSYEAVNGARITLPLVWIDKIDLEK